MLSADQLSKHFDLETLIDNGLLDKTVMNLCSDVPTVSIPQWGKKNRPQFNEFVEKFCLKVSSTDDRNDRDLPSLLKSCFSSDTEIPFSVNNSRSTVLYKNIRSLVTSSIPDTKMESLDLFDGSSAYFIRVSDDFYKYRYSIAMGIIVSCVLSNTSKVTLILPLQNASITCDLPDLSRLRNHIDSYMRTIDLKKTTMEWILSHESGIVGSHIKKGKSIYDTIRGRCNPVAGWQIFLSAPTNFEVSIIPQDEVSKVKQYLNTTGIRMYTHLKYVVNIGKNINLDAATHEMRLSDQMGFRGTVIHLGSNPDTITGIKEMYGNVVELAKYATVLCPLLIETCAREKNDLCWNLGDLIAFYTCLTTENPDIKDKIGICVDTCHVFAAGYNPVLFINEILDRLGSVIKLIHFNDSKGPKYCCVDRHEIPAQGEIGLILMNSVTQIAIRYKIDLIRE